MVALGVRRQPKATLAAELSCTATIELLGSYELQGAAQASAQGQAALLRGVQLAGGAQASATGSGALGGPDADWIARSAGARLADRLDTLPAINLSGTEPSVNGVTRHTAADHIFLDTTIKVPGAAGSLRFDALDSDGPNSGGMRAYFGVGGAFGDGSELWWAFTVYAPPEFTYNPWSHHSGPATKLGIMSVWGSSFQLNEVVTQINYRAGHIHGYAQTGAAGGVSVAANTPCSATDFRFQPAIDNGDSLQLSGNDPETGSPWSDCAQARRQLGMLYSAQSLAQFEPGFGDPLSGGVRFYPNEHLTIIQCVNVGNFGSANSRWRKWVQRGTGPVRQLFDVSGVTLGNASPLNTFWPTTYVTHRSGGGRRVQSMGGQIGGVSVLNCSPGVPLGNASLEYTASSGRFRYKSAVDGYGTGRYFSAVNGVTIINLASASHGVETTLTSTVTLPQSTINVASTAGFPPSGTIIVGFPDTTNPGSSNGSGEQRVQYTGISGNSFTGCTGGVGTHNAASPVVFNSYIQLQLDDVDALPPSGTTEMPITVIDGRPTASCYYNDLIIKDSMILGRGGQVPEGMPVALAGSALASAVSSAALTNTGTSVLAQAVAELNAQIAGGGSHWLQFTTVNATATICNNQGSTGNMIPFANCGAWDPLHRIASIVGQDHGPQHLRHVAYDEATNAWSLVTTIGSVGGHAYDHLACDPGTGDLYFTMYGSGSPVIKKPYGQAWNESFKTKPAISNITYGVALWTGTLSGLSGHSGLFIHEAAQGQFWVLDLVTEAWAINDASPPSFTPGYNNIAAYSAVHNCAVGGGGNNHTRELFRYNSNASWVQMNNAPLDISTGTGGLLWEDPNTGNFLIMGGGQLWELDPVAGAGGLGAYAQQTGLRAPPAGVNMPDGSSNTVCVIPISTYGVTMVVSADAGSSAVVHLYKH